MKKESYRKWIFILAGCIFILLILLAVVYKINTSEKVSDRILEQKLIDCVKKTEVTLYGRGDSLEFESQKERVGKSIEFIRIVDCASDPEFCEDIISVPAWKINEQTYYGLFSKEFLIKLMGCE